jgi:hypothetical protein
MIAIANFFNSYETMQISSNDENIYEYAKNEDISDSFLSDFQGLIPLCIWKSSEVYLNDKCIGFYCKNQINHENHLVTYDLDLYDKSVLPENFDFHFEKNSLLKNTFKLLVSGLGILHNQKMIIDLK